MKAIILVLLLSLLLPAVTVAQSRHIFKLTAGWYSLNDHDGAEAPDATSGQISLAADYQYIWSRHWGVGVHGEKLDDLFLFSPDLLCRFCLPMGDRGVVLTAFAGFFSLDFSDGVLPTAHCGLELDVPLSDHWGLGVSYRLLGIIGASVNNFGANIIYSF